MFRICQILQITTTKNNSFSIFFLTVTKVEQHNNGKSSRVKQPLWNYPTTVNIETIFPKIASREDLILLNVEALFLQAHKNKHHSSLFHIPIHHHWIKIFDAKSVTWSCQTPQITKETWFSIILLTVKQVEQHNNGHPSCVQTNFIKLSEYCKHCNYISYNSIKKIPNFV